MGEGAERVKNEEGRGRKSAGWWRDINIDIRDVEMR